MKEKRYLDESQSYPRIKFPQQIGPHVFENILNECYGKSLLKKTKKAKFDFSEVRWCDVFELSLIAIWMLELKAKGKRVVFVLPNDKHVYQFLVAYRFNVFLEKNGFGKENDFGFRATTASTNLIRAPFYPLTFFSETGFHQLLDDLKFSNRLEVVLNDVKDTEVVKSGAIRDIVLKELIDNLRIHSNSDYSNLIMTKLGSSSDDKNMDWTRNVLNRVSALEKPFFERLHGQSFLALVISDKGDGIHNTLKDAYERDDVLPLPKESPKDNVILEYSFLYHSTRRTLAERIGAIEDVISTAAREFPPPTGLHRLKEIVREFQGLLYARSGASIVCFDFYSNQFSDKAISNTDIKELKTITDFGGTQYKIYFPINLPPKRFSTRTTQFGLKKQASHQPNLYLSVNQFSTSESPTTFTEEAMQLASIFEAIEKLALARADKPATIILDFYNVTYLSSKAIHYLLFEAMQRQTNTLSIIAINIEIDREPWRDAFKHSHTPNHSLKPLTIFDKNFEVDFFGATSEEAALLKAIVNESTTQTEEMRDLAERNNQLFFYDISKNRYQFIHSYEEILRTSREAVQKEVAKALLSTEIFHEEVKVLLPSGRYCKDYFEIYKLLTNPAWKNALLAWYRYWLIELKPEYVISISGHIGKIVDLAIRDADDTTKGIPIQHINLRTPFQEVDLAQLLFKLGRSDKGVIITEVIGTAETLKSVVEQVQHTEVIKILTTVNASEEGISALELKGRTYNIESILNHSLDYAKRLPKEWRYSQVHQVDPDTHVLIKNTVNLEGPLWKGIQRIIEKSDEGEAEIHVNEFLEGCVIPTNSFIEGHFTNRGKHISYLFNIPSLTKHFLKEITNVIVEDVRKHLLNIKPEKHITHVLFLSDNPGLDEIANQISSNFTKCLPVYVSTKEFDSSFNQDISSQGVDAIIVIDDAFVSGESIFKIYDIAERMGASFIFAYAFIKRGPEYLARRFEKISQYGDTTIQARYLSDVEIPTYTSDDCPICERVEELEELKTQLNDDKLISLIDEELNRLIDLPVNVVAAGETLTADSSTKEKGASLLFRWKLELAKKHLGVRKELAMVVKRYLDDPQTTLSLFRVISREKTAFLRDDKLRRSVFYPTFVEDIIKACWHFISQIERLSGEDIESVLSLLITFDDDFLNNHLLTVCERTIHSDEKFTRVIIQLFFSDDAFEYPGRISMVFRKLLDNGELSEDLKRRIENIRAYWVSQEEELKNRQSNKITWYRKLTGSIFHETGHFKDSVISYLDTDPIDMAKVIRSWSFFYDQLLEAIPLLRNCIGNHVSSDLFNKLNPRIVMLEYQTRIGNELVESLNDPQTLRFEEDIDLVIAQIQQCVQQIYTLVFGVDGIKALLETFKTNIKTIAYNVLQQQDEDLRRLNIAVITEYPEEACVVFGEDIPIAQIFQNLIENVWKNSNGNSLKIKAVIEKEEEMLSIWFLDNGKGVPNTVIFDQGLKVVQGITKANCGEFAIKSLPESDKEYTAGYKTAAIVKLPFFKGREHEQ